MRVNGGVWSLLLLSAFAFASANGEDVPSTSPSEGLQQLSSPQETLDPFLDFAPALDAAADGVPEVVTMTNEDDVFYPVSPQHEEVKSMVSKFMEIYTSEVEIANLNANVLHILKAEVTLFLSVCDRISVSLVAWRQNVRALMKTAVRPEIEEQDFGLGVELLQQAMTQQFHIFLLVNYHFKSTMFAEKRPYVTVLRVAMDCANSTNPDGGGVELACDILEHVDLPRVNESTSAVPAYIQREIVQTEPPHAIKNHSLSVLYDALESQELKYDAAGVPIRGAETMKYVRFRVHDGDSQDCMIVVQHSKGISTLLYSDLVCYEDLHAASAAMAAVKYTKENYPTLVFIAAFIGAAVAMLLMHRRRSRQRSGYSYLHSKNSNLPRLSSQSTKTSDSVEPAVAS